ncbi:MAG: hypothetical protein DCF27_01410 [Lysobacteraceae bacterium]|nr:MAG: hypothetical protein DCF27_01410 [Xanthomonadaceae bacterium]
MSALVQGLLIAAVVLFAALSLLRQLWPRGAWQAQARLSYALEREGRPAWLKRLGFALRPPMQATQAACGSGCSSCRACK